jgi:hypothetical protein
MGRVNPSWNVPWDQVAHAYGPATEVPAWITGLRDPARAAECLRELYGSITHQGTRYSATPLCVPLLVEAAQDRAVADRVGVLFLIQFCAMGYFGDSLAWEHQRDLQADRYERSSWNAVAAEHERLRELLSDSDRAVVGAALTVLAWTGDASPRVLAAIRAAIESGDCRDQCTGWLASVVLGQLPPGVAAPRNLTRLGEIARFGAAVAAIRFAGAAAPPGAVDELCSVFTSIEAGKELTQCEFLMPDGPERAAASALGEVPAHLRGHANAQLLAAIDRGFVLGTDPLRAYLRLNLGEHSVSAPTIALQDEARQALTRLLDALANWQVGHRIYELEEYGLPGTLNQLAAWLGTSAS